MTDIAALIERLLDKDLDPPAICAARKEASAVISRLMPPMNIERLKNRIDYRLNECLCEMKPDYDDSITGFNEAWDIVRTVFKEEIDALTRLTAPPMREAIDGECDAIRRKTIEECAQAVRHLVDGDIAADCIRALAHSEPFEHTQ